MELFALFDRAVGETRCHAAWTSVSQANPVDGTAMLNLFSIDMAVVPEIVSTPSVWNQFVKIF